MKELIPYGSITNLILRDTHFEKLIYWRNYWKTSGILICMVKSNNMKVQSLFFDARWRHHEFLGKTLTCGDSVNNTRKLDVHVQASDSDGSCVKWRRFYVSTTDTQRKRLTVTDVVACPLSTLVTSTKHSHNNRVTWNVPSCNEFCECVQARAECTWWPLRVWTKVSSTWWTLGVWVSRAVSAEPRLGIAPSLILNTVVGCWVNTWQTASDIAHCSLKATRNS